MEGEVCVKIELEKDIVNLTHWQHIFENILKEFFLRDEPMIRNKVIMYILPLVWPEPGVSRWEILGLVFIKFIELHGKACKAVVEVVVFRHGTRPPDDTS